MADQAQMQIHGLIIHKVDRRNYDAPQLADLESPISDEVASFMREHISSNREHRFARAARFLAPGPQELPLSAICDCILHDSSEFVPQSRIIAERLFRAMDRRASVGDLVVCLFSEGSENSKWLALLKMDPEDGFVGERQEIDGHVRYVLRRVPNVLPTGELQKCAFVLPSAMRVGQGYDLKVLDQQRAQYGAPRLVASFFVTDFLRCKVGLNPADVTRTFATVSYEWVGKKEEWPADDVDRFKRHVTDALQGEIVDIAGLAPSIIAKTEEQDEYLEYLRSEGLEELTFEPDPKQRQLFTRYATFEGDHGLRVRIDADAVGEDKSLWWDKEPGTDNYIVTIRTTHWTKKPK